MQVPLTPPQLCGNTVHRTNAHHDHAYHPHESEMIRWRCDSPVVCMPSTAQDYMALARCHHTSGGIPPQDTALSLACGLLFNRQKLLCIPTSTSCLLLGLVTSESPKRMITTLKYMIMCTFRRSQSKGVGHHCGGKVFYWI